MQNYAIDHSVFRLEDLHSNLSTRIIELEGKINLKTKRDQLEESVNEQIVRLKASITNLLKNKNLPCLKKIQDAKTLLSRLETVEETLEFAETVTLDNDNSQSMVKENLKILRNMLTNLVTRLLNSNKTIIDIFDNVNKIESVCSSHETTFIRKYADNLKISVLSEKLDEVKTVSVQILQYRHDFENELLEKFEQAKGDLGLEERQRRNSQFEEVAKKLKTLAKNLAEIETVLKSKIDKRRSVLKSAQSLASWLENEHEKLDREPVLSTDVDGVVRELQRWKDHKLQIDSQKENLREIQENSSLVDIIYVSRDFSTLLLGLKTRMKRY